jgi:hypothetical protein
MMRFICLATLLALAVSLAGCKTQPPPKKDPPPAAVKVKAGDLLKEYSTNAIGADAKYKDKVIAVSGKFSSVQKAVLLGYILQLLPEDAGDLNASYVQCVLAESAVADAGKLQPGQMITVEGTCDGQVLAQVKVSKCVLVK